MTVASVYAVFADREEAERICRTLVEERLAACANMFSPIRSVYRWEERIETADEVAAILKTRAERADDLLARLIDLHSYEVPCAVMWPIDKVVEGYASWVESSVR